MKIFKFFGRCGLWGLAAVGAASLWNQFTGGAADEPTAEAQADEYVPRKEVTVRYDYESYTPFAEIPEECPSKILEYPGFTVSFNAKHKQPNYVAWAITKENLFHPVVPKRTDNFAPDPTVKGCPDLEDYRGSGYDRGHMAPAADMKWSEDAMNASFLLTNMSPQMHELNDGSWKKLEEKCREWAIRDDIVIVVCGPILSDPITKAIGKGKVTVPQRYFKVVLEPYANPPRGIGFVMPNGQVPGGMQKAACSIDQIEEITGIDFFPRLPEEVQDQIESVCDFNAWSHP